MLKNGLYNVIGAVIRMLLSLLTIPLLIRLMGVEEYGLWTLTSAVIGIVSLAEAGLSVSTTVFISRDLATNDTDGVAQTLTITGVGILTLATLATIGLWASAPLLVNLFPKLTDSQHFTAIYAFQLGALTVWSRLLQQILVGVEQAYQRYGVMNTLSTVQTLLTSIGLITVVWFGGRTIAMMQWLAITNIVILIAHVRFCWVLLRHLNLALQWHYKRAQDIVRFGIMTWFGSLGGVLFNQCDRFIIGAVLDTHILGIYGAITSIMIQINTLSSLPVQPLLPLLSSRYTQDKLEDHQPLEAQIKIALQVNTLVALGVGAALFTVAPLLITSLLGTPPTSELITSFRLAATIYALYSINAVGYYILLGVNALKTFVLIQLFSGVFALLLITVGSSRFGLLGAIAGNIGYLGVWFFTIFAMQKLQIPIRTWLRWLQFPFLWFLVLIITVIIIGQSRPELWLVITVIQSLLLAVWFGVSQAENLRIIFQKIRV